jgi:hypothetical protein
MTFKEDFYNEYPNAPVSADGCPYLCPWHAGYVPRGDCQLDCVKCWNREMPEGKE